MEFLSVSEFLSFTFSMRVWAGIAECVSLSFPLLLYLTLVPGECPHHCAVLVCLAPSDSAMLVRNTLWGKNKAHRVAHFLVGSPPNECAVIHWLRVSQLIGFKITRQNKRTEICQLTIKHFQLRSVWNGSLRWLQLPEQHTNSGEQDEWCSWTHILGFGSRCGLFIIPSHKHHHARLNIIIHAWTCPRITSHSKQILLQLTLDTFQIQSGHHH